MKFIFKVRRILLLATLSVPLIATVDIDDLRQIDGFFCLNNDEPYNGEVIHQEKGMTRFKGQMVDGLMYGEWRYYHPNRSLYAKGHFVDGDGLNTSYISGVPRNGRDGTWIFYYPTGIKSSEYTYRNRVKAGLQREWFENGQIQREENIDTGEQTIWYENGRKKYQGFPDQNRYTEFYQNGQPKKMADPDAGIMKEWYFSGKLKMEGAIDGNQRHGQWILYNEKGQILEKVIYDQGNRTGTIQPSGKTTEADSSVMETVISYYDNRLTKEKGYLSGGQKAGIWIFYHWNGKKKSEGAFRAGLMEGEWQFWNEEGQLITREYYLAGQRHGHQFVWENSGRLKSKGQFKYGQRDGLWIFYLSNGDKQTGFYKEGEKDGRWSYYYADGTEMAISFDKGKSVGDYRERVVE